MFFNSTEAIAVLKKYLFFPFTFKTCEIEGPHSTCELKGIEYFARNDFLGTRLKALQPNLTVQKINTKFKNTRSVLDMYIQKEHAEVEVVPTTKSQKHT